ncbi:MAG: alpha/beta hydrolase-fold protein [Eubacteriales bacterium]
MAYIEFNALSKYLGGSFSAGVFAPELKEMKDDKRTDKKYPVLYLIHDDGGDFSDIHGIEGIEKLASELKMYIIAPSIAHSFCLDMDYGPEYEKFISKEFPGICRNMFSIKDAGEGVYIGGIGTGAYGAAMIAKKYPKMFEKCICINGQFDVVELFQKAEDGEALPYENLEMLKAIFGPLEKLRGSEKDILADTRKSTDIPIYITAEKKNAYYNESIQFSEKTACIMQEGKDLSQMVKDAICWLMK